MRHAEDEDGEFSPEDLAKLLEGIKTSKAVRSAVKAYMAEDEDEKSEEKAQARAYSDPKLGASWKTSNRIKTDFDRSMSSVDQVLIRRFEPKANSDNSVISEMLSIYRKEKVGFRPNKDL